MATRKRVLFLIPHLGGGGAERVIARLAGGLSTAKYDVHVGLITQTAAHSEALPASVTVHALGVDRVRAAIVPLIRLIWRLRPDLIFSGIFHLNFLVLLVRPLLPWRTRCVVRQNGLTSNSAETSVWTRVIYRVLYPRAEAIVCQSETMAGELLGLLGNAKKLRVLPNPVAVSIAAQDCSSLWEGRGPHLLAIGRLVPAKGFDMLLQAFALIAERFSAADLTILGHGPEGKALWELSNELGIHPRVHFAGYVEQPEKWFPCASAFVLSSRHDAMPNAMLEAAMAGLAIVATPAHGGVAALLSGQPGTWVAGDISAEALAQVLCTALASLQPEERFQHEWIAPFRAPNALARYERLIDEVLGGATA
jgi:glycosyltransferase involved in cell wall biosynthesis